MSENEVLDKFFKELNKEVGAVSYEDSKFAQVQTWVDTGDYGLNRVISGDIHKGVPMGRIVALNGESQTGKSYVASRIAANALKANQCNAIIYFDSEGGSLNTFFESCGVDTTKLKHILLNSIEDATLKIKKTLNMISAAQKKDPTFRAVMVLDSLGALVEEKIDREIDKDKIASDMGGKAKLINRMIKSCTIPTLVTDTLFIIINHVYDDPSGPPSKIKHTSGGKGIQYLARIAIQLTKSFEKNDDAKSENVYKSTVLKFMVTKNSYAKPFFTTEMLLDFSKGPHKYFGLLKYAMRHGFIENPTQGYYTVPSYSTNKLRLKQILDTPEIWATFLDKLNEKSKAEMCYGGEEGMDLEDEVLEESILDDDAV